MSEKCKHLHTIVFRSIDGDEEICEDCGIPLKICNGDKVTPNYYDKKCECGKKLDPYYICDLYDNNKGSAWHHAVKKLLRSGDGHKDFKKDIKEVRDTLNRLLEDFEGQE